MSTKREDAELTFFLATQLESASEQVETLYPQAKYSTLIPVDSSDPEGAEAIGYIRIDKVGMSAIIADGAADSPAVDAYATKVLLPVHELGNHWSISKRELRNIQMSGMALDSARMSASAMAVETHHDRIAMLGDGTKDKVFGGMYGVVYHANTTKVAATGAWSGLTVDQIIADFATMYTRIITDTKGVFVPNTFAMSPERLAYLNGLRLTSTDKTLLSFLKETYSDCTFESHYLLSSTEVLKNPSTGAGGNFNVVLCYHKSPTVLRYKMPMPYKSYPATDEGRDYTVETASTTAGVEARQPLAVVVYYGA